MIYIDEVKKTYRYDGHCIITHVCYTSSLYVKATNWCTKSEMVRYMLSNPSVKVKTKARPNGYWVEGEDVRVVNGEYLRTDANNYSWDNLGELDK